MGDVPSGLADRVIFSAGTSRKLNTNNLNAATYFESINILDSGYNIHGNSVRIGFFSAHYPAGTSSTFRPDIVAWGDLYVTEEVQGSTLNLLGDIILANNNLIFPVASVGDVNLQGVISGTGSVVKNSTAGEVTFSGSGANTYTGATRVEGGTLRLSRYALPFSLGTVAVPGDLIIGFQGSVVLERNNQIADTAEVINDWGILDLNDNTDTIGSLTGFGGVRVATNGKLTVGANNRTTSYPGGISGGGSFDKIGIGTLVFSGEHTFTGPTRILNGRLRVDGRLTSTSSITVSNGATLSGIGSVSDVNVSTGGILHPGAGGANGSLLATGVVTFAAASIFQVELAAPSSFDSLTIASAGAVNLGSSTLRVLPGPGVKEDDSFSIVTKLGTGAVTGTFQGLPEGQRFVVSNRVFQITYRGGTGNDVVLTRLSAPAVSLSITGPHLDEMQISGRGVPTLLYVLEGTSNLKPPITWKPLGTNVANASGGFSFVDAYTNRTAARFYRAWSP